MPRNVNLHHLICSFCGRPQSEVEKMIAGPSVYICSDCVRACKAVIEQDLVGKHLNLCKISTPQKIRRHLDDWVIGQHTAKKILSVAVYNHYKRMLSPPAAGGGIIAKSNILLLGPTGSGKTLLARTLAKKLNVAFATADATVLTEAGYVGEDVESMISSLLCNAGWDLERARQGIIYIDEIDKIARRTDMESGRDVSGEGVQQALLKILEGTRASVATRKGGRHSQKEWIRIDTSDILFICGGTFSGIENIIKKRIGSRTIGFGASHGGRRDMHPEQMLSLIEPEDLLQYGFIPEFIGRLPIIAPLRELSEVEMLRILTEPKDALTKQYQKLFAMEGVHLSFTEEALSAVVRRAQRRKAGARGLRAVMEACMLDIMYELPDYKNVVECIIGKDVIQNHARPGLSFGPARRQA
ncbi:MAG: ATP-dependent Clp protease ATP-binding subunit ClpX [Desulfosalsimonadaceae bacterium]